jgi:hypothetical protein
MMSKPSRAKKPAASTSKKPEGAPQKLRVDWREQLYNDRSSGPIKKVQLPASMITRLYGILLDIDPNLFRKTVVSSRIRANPRLFYKKRLRAWLSRHAALRDAEVRISGRGLHVIIWLEKPVEFASDAERQRWSGIVRAVQAVLPVDPDMPGITALTRPCGSINSKNGAAVELLRPGKPVSQEPVLQLFELLRTKPFGTVMGVLFGTERATPCPVCRQAESTLTALDVEGRCYGSCGNVRLGQLFDALLAPRLAKKGK